VRYFFDYRVNLTAIITIKVSTSRCKQYVNFWFTMNVKLVIRVALL